MAKLTPDATRTEYGLVINQKIIPWGARWPKDSGKYKKGDKYKADRRPVSYTHLTLPTIA